MYYATNDETADSLLRDHIKSYRLLNGGHFYWDTNRFAHEIYSLIYSRFQEQYGEYVLTHYYLKEYDSPEKRLQVAHALASFYREVTFRAVAEASYVYADSANWLSYGEKCAVANFIANRVHNYIFIAFTDFEKFEQLRHQFRLKLDQVCYDNLALNRYAPLGPDCIVAIDPQCVSDTHAKNEEIRELIEANQEKCVND